MIKAAIVTLYGNFNYGNRLQNYALQTVLENHGCNVSTLTADSDISKVKRFLKKYVEKRNGKYHFKKLKETKREKAFDKFTQKHIRTIFFHTQEGKIPSDVNTEYDIFIVGSDQVWNPLFWKDSNESKDLYNFLLGFSNKKNISYAASFGIENLSQKWKQRIQPLLRNFDLVSVREKTGCNITQMLGVQSEVVLDPTLLLQAEDWRKIEEGVVTDKDYILTYFLGEEPDHVKKEIKEISKQHQYAVFDLYDENCKYYSYGPEVFLELIDKAKVVYTDSFHAVVFAMIFHTEFVVFNRKHANHSDMSSRIRTLLEVANIEDGISKDKMIYNQNFKEYDKHLRVAREKSLLFIKKALDISMS